MSLMPPEFVPADGKIWAVRRAWPGPDGRIALEAVTPQGLVRAGWADTGLLPSGEDPKLPALRGLAARGILVSHRPAKRAVVRLGDTFVKVVRPGRAPAILEAIGRAKAFDGPFRMARVTAHDESSVTFAALPGRSMHEPEVFTPAEWARAWHDILGAWATASLADPGAGTTIHAGAEEAVVLRDWFARARPLIEDAAPFGARVEEIAARLQEHGEHDLGHAHRDLHDKQLLWDERLGPALLDVDTACVAPRALDLGNLRAHARWRARQGLWTPGRARVVSDTVDEVAARLGVAAADLALYEAAALLRLGCVYAFRPGWAHEAAGLRESLLGAAAVA